MKICADIHDPQWMNPNDFGDPVTFSMVKVSIWPVKCLNMHEMAQNCV